MNVQVGRGAGLMALLLLTLSFPPAPAAGQDAPSAPAEERGPHIRHPEGVKAMAQLKSPYCPGFMLEVCSSAAGAALRDSIDMLAFEGWSSDSIVDWMLARHGQEYLALPRREGKALVAWVVPPLAVLAGFGVVIVALRSMRRSKAPLDSLADPTDDEEESLREALRELEAEEDTAPFI